MKVTIEFELSKNFYSDYEYFLEQFLNNMDSIEATNIEVTED